MDTGATVTQIGKYPVLGILGVGGMGVVYRAMDKSVGREVAIKTLTEATEELRERFLLEARSGILNHPNIVTVYDFGEQDGSPYIVMEYLPGDSLENLLRAGRQFSLIEKLDIVRQLCLGLGYAHQKGVIHRDIKPANLMILPDGTIKIVDFGVAKLENRAGKTQTGMVIGTFHYISPERLLGKQADGGADIWSAGVILYLLLTGKLPFPGDDPATLHRVIREAHEPISHFLSGYPPALDHVVDRALAKDPLDRYQDAEEMAADLDAINDDLKREHVAQSMGNVKAMIESRQWTAVRPLLLDLQRLNPQNPEIKRLLREVQENLSRQQKTVQLRQVLADAEEAVLAQRYAEALDLYTQAADVDRSNTELTEKIAHVRQLKEKADKVAQLLTQARDARHRSDYSAAGQLIDSALALDERNTDLRNERARIVQEAEKALKQRSLQPILENARSQVAARQFTEALQTLRSALEIDPTDPATQQLYQEAVDRQEEQRRRAIIDQIAGEISEHIASGELDRALELIQRAQQKLPGEAVLLQLKLDAENRKSQQEARKLVEKTSLIVYDLIPTDPQKALTAVHEALEQFPSEPQLIALEEKVSAQLRKATDEERKAGYLKEAQEAIDAKDYPAAIQTLQAAAIEFPGAADLRSLLELAQAEQARRVDALLTRVQTLGEKDPAQALQLISTQPPAILTDPRIQQLQASLTAAQQKLTAAQLQAAAAQPQSTAVQPQATAAIAQPAPATAAIPAPAPPAFQPVPLAQTTAPAESAFQPVAIPVAAPAAQAKPKSGSGSTILILLVVLILLAAAAGAGYWFFLRPAPVAVAPSGILQLNATPYAEVLSVTSADGKTIPLPPGDHWTPLRLDGLAPGSYSVTFKGADGQARTQQCQVAETAQICGIEISPVDDPAIEQIIGGAK
jgi:serine/threonine-protein kinase